IAAASVLVVYLIGQLKPESELGTIATGGWLLAWMILLSFPASLLFMFFIVVFTEIGFRQDSFSMLFIWASLFAVGYWQWCRFVPSLLGREIITLDLESGRERTLGPGRAEPDLSSDLTRREVIEPPSSPSEKRL
ncbi:MAG TPA: hypothetical protein VE842_13160, partial [Pyrinomonadaceae bacterium]|nr:hypothetical protein [Pyrinomonadaceae bacterium]